MTAYGFGAALGKHSAVITVLAVAAGYIDHDHRHLQFDAR
jgi:hypothetical protein